MGVPAQVVGEYRLCDELKRAPVSEAPGLWCDGFIPERFFNTSRATFVTGRVWMSGIPHEATTYQESWPFTLRLNLGVESRDDVDWGQIDTKFQVDFTARSIVVHGAACGMNDIPSSEFDPRQDAIDFLAQNGIHAVVRDWAPGETIIAMRNPSEANGITVWADALCLIPEDRDQWAVESLTDHAGSLLFASWKEACDHVIGRWEKPGAPVPLRSTSV